MTAVLWNGWRKRDEMPPLCTQPGHGWCAAGTSFSVYLYENSHFQQIPVDIAYLPTFGFRKSNDSHISVRYFLDRSCCTCAMRSMSGVVNTSQAGEGRCNAELAWNPLKGHFSWNSFNIQGLRRHGQKLGGNWRWHTKVVFVMLLYKQ